MFTSISNFRPATGRRFSGGPARSCRSRSSRCSVSCGPSFRKCRSRSRPYAAGGNTCRKARTSYVVSQRASCTPVTSLIDFSVVRTASTKPSKLKCSFFLKYICVLPLFRQYINFRGSAQPSNDCLSTLVILYGQPDMSSISEFSVNLSVIVSIFMSFRLWCVTVPVCPRLCAVRNKRRDVPCRSFFPPMPTNGIRGAASCRCLSPAWFRPPLFPTAAESTCRWRP